MASFITDKIGTKQGINKTLVIFLEHSVNIRGTLELSEPLIGVGNSGQYFN